MSPDVICFLMGRLGNNLFIAAATAAYAHRHGLSWSLCSDYHVRDIYEFGLPVAACGGPERMVWRETGFGYTPIPEQPAGTRLILSGFFQSYRYFADCPVYIRSIFSLPAGPPVNAVSVHVRRTDFAHYGTAFRMLPLDYYARASRAFVIRGQRDFLVFSDDLDWCRAYLPGCHAQARFQYCEEKNPRRALGIMAACRDHIIANSSFSWWGAWLNPRSRMVIAPRHEDWFGDRFKCVGTKDLYPPEWTQLDA